MERLGHRDLEATISYLRGLYTHDDPGSLKRHILTTITDLVPSELTTYNELDLRTSENVWEWEPTPPDFAELTQAFAAHMDENPCVAYFRRLGDGRATRISDFLTRRELHGLGYYREYLSRVGLEYRMSVVLPKDPDSVVALALGRSGRDFSGRDRLVLDLLRPHLVQAYENAAVMSRLRREPPRPDRDELLPKASFARPGLTEREAEILLGVARDRPTTR